MGSSSDSERVRRSTCLKPFHSEVGPGIPHRALGIRDANSLRFRTTNLIQTAATRGDCLHLAPDRRRLRAKSSHYVVQPEKTLSGYGAKKVCLTSIRQWRFREEHAPRRWKRTSFPQMALHELLGECHLLLSSRDRIHEDHRMRINGEVSARPKCWRQNLIRSYAVNSSGVCPTHDRPSPPPGIPKFDLLIGGQCLKRRESTIVYSNS